MADRREGESENNRMKTIFKTDCLQTKKGNPYFVWNSASQAEFFNRKWTFIQVVFE